MSENELWSTVIIVLGCTIVGIAACVAYVHVKSAPLEKEALVACVKAGGTWQYNNCYMPGAPKP